VDAKKAAAALESELRSKGTPERAAGAKRYLKSDLEFFGTSLGEIRATAKVAFAKVDDHDDLVALLEELWRLPIHERRMAAALGLELKGKLLVPADLPMIERFLRESKTWALVDWIAVKTMGGLVESYPEVIETTDRWATDDDFWIRRSAVLSQHDPLKNGAPFEVFSRYADPMITETEFFIRKAIGWVLRDASKRRPDDVWEWIAPRAHRASGVTMREVVKYLGAERADALMRAYRTKTPI
jgi:3-methyladenine DNA glycosylase AlkD